MKNPIRSLDKEKIMWLLKQHGPDIFFNVLFPSPQGIAVAGFSLARDALGDVPGRRERQELAQFRKALPKMIQSAVSKEVAVVAGAFNSKLNFVTAFQSAAFGAVPIVLLTINKAIARVGSSLKGIRGELSTMSMAKIQGWETDGFGSHIYRFVRREMSEVMRSNAQKPHRKQRQRHFFYVWHPDTDWYPTFEEKQRKKSLGKNFGGFHTDLGTLCQRMRSDRETLIRTTDYGQSAVLHLLIPAHGPLVVDQPLAFHSALSPLVVTGQRHRNVDLVWLNVARGDDHVELQCIGTLEKKEARMPYSFGGYLACWAGAASCAVAAAAFPPCAPVATQASIGFGQAAIVSGTVGMGLEAVVNRQFDDDDDKVQVLGECLFACEGVQSVSRWKRNFCIAG